MSLETRNHHAEDLTRKEFAIEARSLRKSFGAEVALNDVTLGISSGEVVAIVGENGAGKSTLIGCLTGSLRPDAGIVMVNGDQHSGLTPKRAIANRIAAIRQEPDLVPAMSVTENLLLGSRDHGRFLSRGRLRRREAVRRLTQSDVLIDPDALIENLSPADRQMVEIARAVGAGARVLFFDEPTAALTPIETARLFTLIRQMRSEGAAVAYISHRLEEVLEISDRVVVLRDGRVVDEGPTDEFNETRLVASMTGREITTDPNSRLSELPSGSVNLMVRGLACRRLTHADIDVRGGEIVGVAGIVGSSRSQLLSVLAGDSQARSGDMTLLGRQYRPRSPREALLRGVALVSEDRHNAGLFLDLDQAENVMVGTFHRRSSQGGLTSAPSQRRGAAEILDRLAVSPRDPRLQARALSGGNQQKLLIGRALLLKPELLLLDEPTRGVDVAAKADIHALVRAAARNGSSVLVVSSDLRELVQLSDRIVVMARGRTVGEFSRPFDPTAIMRAAVADAKPRSVHPGGKH